VDALGLGLAAATRGTLRGAVNYAKLCKGSSVGGDLERASLSGRKLADISATSSFTNRILRTRVTTVGLLGRLARNCMTLTIDAATSDTPTRTLTRWTGCADHHRRAECPSR